MSLNRFRWHGAAALLLAGGLVSGSAAAAPSDPDKPPPAPPGGPVNVAERAKEIFQAHCFECHGGLKSYNGVKVMDRDLLVDKKKVVVPGKPEESKLFQLITAKDESAMPQS